MPNDVGQPLISVIMPVYNGTATLDRALRSLEVQTFSDWELMAVDDGSSDGSPAILQTWAARDRRIRLLSTPENAGPAAARNVGVRSARGEFVTYLDHDDEYYADYLAQVAQLRDTADVLVFAMDVVHDDRNPLVVAWTWEPAQLRANLFAQNIVVPLGVAHRRTLWEKVGGFNEILPSGEDDDFLRRVARTGVEFRFVAFKSGRYHLRAGSRSRALRLTRRQRETVEDNFRARKPVYGDRPLGFGQRPVRKIAFTSSHCLVDFTSGAAVATCQALRLLQGHSFQCRAFCGCRTDGPRQASLEKMLADRGTPYEARAVAIDGYQARMVLTEMSSPEGVPVTIFRTQSPDGQWAGDAEITAFYKAWAQFLDADRPDVVMAYGGDPTADTLIKLAKSRDIPVVFGLHDFSCRAAEAFASVDYVTVPSEFSRQHHWNQLGLACHAIPPVLDWPRVETPSRQPRYVTFVNPQPTKGVYVFARIAEQLARRRPDIPLLVVEGPARSDVLRRTGVDAAALANVTVMPATADPRQFYGVTKLLLMPSLWSESFGLVAAEAMLNGIPVLASNRGALPETIGEAGFLFDIPSCYTPHSRRVPTAEEVEPWVETIIRLWDDAAFYQHWSDAGRAHAERWRPERVAPIYGEFFSGIFPQPGPPVVPRDKRGVQSVGSLQQPLISVILPVYNGTATLERAIRSVQTQTFSDWELVAVDDGSTDSSHAVLQSWAAGDSRIRVVRLDENRGPGAARNAGLQVARGEWIAYLDHDDQYYPDYLAHMDEHVDEADVLVFAYDIIRAEDGSQIAAWEPGTAREEIYSAHIAMPMAVAHRRQLAEKAGLFNELLWWEEDAEFLWRLARAGVEFRFLPQKSGRYYVRADSHRRMPRLTQQQKETFRGNFLAGRPLFGVPSAGTARRNIHRVAFASPYCVIDHTNGAAVASACGLRLLQQVGFECLAFCGSYLDVAEEGALEQMLAKGPYETKIIRIGDYEARMISTARDTIPVTIFRSASTHGQWLHEAEVAAFLRAYGAFLDEQRPDVIWTYGGDGVADAMVRLAKNRDIPVVFGLHNFGYFDIYNFAPVDYVTVPSDFSRRHHWAKLGLACHTLPNVIDWQRVEVTGREPRFVTFVNPQPTKGLYVFARIAAVLAARRPDIRLLVVEGRSHTAWRQETGIDLEHLSNISVMPSTSDPREFYAVTKFVLMPSLWNESFGLVAAEAMLNGIPVLGSNRGALPETIGDGGHLFDIPACYRPETRTVPTAAEVEPWVETIIRLWDDAAYYERWSDTARAHAERWRPERLAPIYTEFFSNVAPQPSPPVVPKDQCR